MPSSPIRVVCETARILALALTAHAALSAASVLLISIDGMRPDYVTDADRHGLKIPSLRRFVSEGTYAGGVTGVTPTITYPSHTTLVTGVSPAQHGIYGNTKFDPLLENLGGWYWYASEIRVPTLWSAADQAGMVVASVNWPASVGAKGVRYLIPEYWRAHTPDDRKLLEALTRPEDWLQELESKLGPYTNGNDTTLEGDEVRTKYAVEILLTKKPGFMTLHLTSLDETEHETSPFSKQSNETLEALDAMLGRLIAAAFQANPDGVVAVVSDHGFVRTDHRVNLMVPFIQNGLVKLGKPAGTGAETIESWDAEPWMAGSAAIMLRQADDTVVRDRVKRMLTELAAKPENGIARVLDADEVRKTGGFPGATFLVELTPGYQFGGALSGPLITAAPSTGTHGYLPDRPEMRSSFFILGRGVAAGNKLGLIDMRQIAPTLASILRVQLPSATQPALVMSVR
jgi:predicted AlkP superfamily pyrophosphatase or phosphodiesterase